MILHFLGNKNVVKMLLDNKAYVNAKDDEGQTALFYAAWEGLY